MHGFGPYANQGGSGMGGLGQSLFGQFLGGLGGKKSGGEKIKIDASKLKG
jgi:hypothetical protein